MGVEFIQMLSIIYTFDVRKALKCAKNSLRLGSHLTFPHEHIC